MRDKERQAALRNLLIGTGSYYAKKEKEQITAWWGKTVPGSKKYAVPAKDPDVCSRLASLLLAERRVAELLHRSALITATYSGGQENRCAAQGPQRKFWARNIMDDGTYYHLLKFHSQHGLLPTYNAIIFIHKCEELEHSLTVVDIGTNLKHCVGYGLT